MRKALMSTKTHAPANKGWAWIWQVLGLVFAFYILEQDIEYQLLDLRLLPQAGTIGITQKPAPDLEPGQLVVTAVEPGSPLSATGVSVGDHIRYDRRLDFYRLKRVGEPVGFTLGHAGRQVHETVLAVPWPQDRTPLQLASDFGFNLADMISTLIGAFILLRSRGKLATLALGGALISFGLTAFQPQLLESGWSTVAAFVALNYGATAFLTVLFVAFAALFYRDNGGRVAKAVWGLLAAYATVEFAMAEMAAYCTSTATQLPIVGDVALVTAWLDYAGFAAAFGYLFAGWRQSSRDTRRRYTLLLMAISAVIFAQVVQIALYNFSLVSDYRHSPWIIAYDVAAGVIAPLLFAYAILRQKVFDLGFAINRTLVYGVVSVVLLVGFGLVEWASEKFIPIESREKNLFIDAAIALGIFLVFHRVRDFAEEIIEDIFFRRWRDNEKELRKFVTEAGFILQRPALLKGLVKALKRFSGGAEVAVYLPGDGNDYVLAEGAFSAIGQRLDGDDETLVSLRAARLPQETKEGTLALPMTHRNALSGMVAVGQKPSGDAWRPDEREVLAWAVLQAGHDLHALKVEQLEADTAALRQTNAILSAQVEMAKAR